MTKVKKSDLRKITVTAIMSAIAAILQFVEFSIPIIPSFVKLDFSDLPALITSFAIGPSPLAHRQAWAKFATSF